MFGWCASGHHDQCRREFKRYWFEPKSKKNPSGLVISDEVVYCECSKRGCKCYVKKADRAKRKKVKR